MKTQYWVIRILVLLVSLGAGLRHGRAQESVSFAFSGFIEFEQRLPVPGFSIGDQFYESYTFNPFTVGAPNEPPDETVDTEYWAITSWEVTIPSKGITFNGPAGEIAVGNNTFFQHNDRYVVTMFPDANHPPVVSGHQFRFFQIDLFDLGFSGADLLQNTALPLSPPDLERIPAVDRRGRFVFNDASYQNRTTSLTLVPEPSTVALMLAGGTIAAFGWCSAKRADYTKRPVTLQRAAIPSTRRSTLYRDSSEEPIERILARIQKTN